MALINFLKKKKEQIDKAIPDLNVRQRAGQAVKQVGRTISNVERVSQQAGSQARRQINTLLAQQQQRQAEQAQRRAEEARLRQERDRQERERLNSEREFKMRMQQQGIGGGRQFRKELFNLDNIRKSTGQALYENKPLKIARGVADVFAPVTTARNYIRSTGQAFGAGIEEFGLRKEQREIDKENEAISKIKDPREALRRSQANSERARKLAMLREEKMRTVNVPKVLADTALFAGDTALSATGTKAAIKAGKPTVKKIAKEAIKRTGQRAGIGAGFGAGTSISEGERDVKQIAKQAALSGAANVAIGGLIDVAPSVVSKAGKKIQTALDQPKFKPGFASTKPKVSIEPKQPKTEAPKIQRKVETEIPAMSVGYTVFGNPYSPKVIRMYDEKLLKELNTAPEIIDINNKIRNITNNFNQEQIRDLNTVLSYTRGRTPEGTRRKEYNIDDLKIILKNAQDIKNKTFNSNNLKFTYRETVKKAPTVKITQPKTEAPVVKLATTETPEQLAKKAVKDIPGFEPAIEAKPAEATRIEFTPDALTKLQTRLQKKPQSNIVVMSKNKRIPDLTKTDVQQIARNTKKTPQEVIRIYEDFDDRVFKTSEKPIANIQASLTDFIRNPEKWDKQVVTPKKEKVLTNEILYEPEKLARQTLDKVIPEKVFGKEPALKSTLEQKARFGINQATRDEAIPKLQIEPKKTIIPEELARETIQKAIKEPISPEIAPVARVSTKADIKVSPEAKIDDRFPINRNLDRGQKINYDDFIEKSINAKSEVEKNILERYLKLETADIANEYNARTGKQFQNLVDELESGNLDKRAGTLYDEVSNILNASNKINEVRNKQVTGKIENYFLHKSQANVDEILSGQAQRNTGNILYTAGFGKKRTGALTEYAKTPDAMVAYWLESMGPLDEASSGLVKTANQIKNAIQKNTNIDTDGNIKSIKDVDYFSFVKDNMPSTGVNKYENVKTNYFPGTRSVKNRVFQLADRKFYDDFLEPFLDAQQFYDNAVDDITKLNKNQLNNLASELNVRVKEGVSDNELKTRIAMHYKKEFFGPASEKFIKNVANIDTRDPNTIRLINDIAEEYIGNEVRKLSVLERATGGLRLLNAMGVLGLNISTAVQNVLEIKKTFARTGIKNTSQALLDYFQGKSLKKKYGVHSTSNIFEDEGVAGLRQVAPLVFTFSNITEDFKDRVFLSALERLGQSRGLDGNDLKYFVRSNFEQFGIKMGRGENIGLFSGKKGNVIQDIPKTAFQFMQFPIKDTVALVDTLEKGFSKFSKDKKMNEDLSTAIGYMGLSAVQALVLGGLGGVGVSALLDRIGFEGLSRSEDKKNILQRGLLGQIGFGSQTGFTPLDFITQISRGDITGPQVDLIANIYKYAQAILAPESDRKEEELNKAREEFNRSMLVTFIPTTNQLYNKTWKYLLDRKRGYFETRGKDKNVANLTTENAWGMIRAFMFGGSYDPERQEYIRKIKESKSPNLGEQESAIFKEIKERQGIESAKQFFEGIMTKREADKALEQLEKGAEAEKPKGMSEEEWSKVKATSEAYITSGLATTDDFVNYFARNIDFDKTGAERTKNESKIFTLINEINDDDKYKKLSPEQKEEVTNALLEKSKISKDIFDYYNKAKRSVTIKYQTVLEELDKNLSENPNFDVIDYLVQGRRNINGSRLASQEVLKLLEKDGIITNDQYKALNKLNFIYLDGEFKDKSTKSSQGKGGKGGKGGRKKAVPKAKDTLALIKLKSKPKITAIKLQRQPRKPVVKLAPSRKAQTKKLTIRNIRVI